MQSTLGCIRVGSEVLLRSMLTDTLERVKLFRETADDRRVVYRRQRPVAQAGEVANGCLYVSTAAPLGRALLGKARGDVVTIEAPAGVLSWEIVEVFD